MIVLIAGGLIVMALVAWAVTRSMEAPSQSPVVAANQSEPIAPIAPTGTQTPLTNTITITNPLTPTPAEPVHTQDAEHASAPRIEFADLKDAVAKGKVTVIDVRDSISYSNGHIPGAMHIPLARIETEMQFLPKNKPIVTYCT